MTGLVWQQQAAGAWRAGPWVLRAEDGGWRLWRAEPANLQLARVGGEPMRKLDWFPSLTAAQASAKARQAGLEASR